MAKQQQPASKKEDLLSRRLRLRDEFIVELAKFLVGNQAGKSIALSMPSGPIPWAREWANLRQKTTLQGYPTEAQARVLLREFLGLP